MTKKIGNINPNAFDSQMLLLDMFLGNVKVRGKKNQLISGNNKTNSGFTNKLAKNVPYIDNASSLAAINNIMSLDMTKIQSFIESLTPQEYAKIYPSITLSVVDVNGLEQKAVPLPMTKPADISKRSGPGFYSTNQFGLTSLDMTFDSNDNPFFGKNYIVSTEFNFDSVNTYTSPIPGLQAVDKDGKGGYKSIPVSYANIFRSSGRVGETSFSLKLDIGYDSNDNGILKRYNLRSPDMSFSIFLSFLKSTIDVKENLSVVVKAEFMSREEKIFNSTQIFDILSININAQRETYEKIVDTADLKREAIEKARQITEKNLKKTFQADLEVVEQDLLSVKKSGQENIRLYKNKQMTKDKFLAETRSLGYVIQGLQAERDNLERKYWQYSKQDSHPSNEGHKQFAQQVIAKLYKESHEN